MISDTKAAYNYTKDNKGQVYERFLLQVYEAMHNHYTVDIFFYYIIQP